MAKTLYFNLEDDIKQITEKIKHEKGADLVLVFPKKSYLFADGVNLKILKKQTDLLGKKISILTMDDRGQVYAKDAGFNLKFLPSAPGGGLGDIHVTKPERPRASDAPTTHFSLMASEAKTPRLKKPQKPIARTGQVVPKVEVRDTIFPDLSPTTELLRQQTSKRDYRKKVIVGAFALVLIFAVLLVTIILPKARVIVYAKSDPVARDVEVTLSTSASIADASKLVLPAQPISTQLEAREKFTAFGKKEVGSKAEGKVRIFNFSSSPLNLKAATTTLTIGGKKYYFLEDQNNIKVVKASESTNPNAGYVATVIAAEGGSEFNAPSGTRLEISNQVFGSKPQFLYARSEGEITGGNSRFVSIVSDDDISKAKSSLTESLLTQLRKGLEKDGMVIIDKAFNVEVVYFSTDKPSGTESQTFEASIKASFKGIAYSTSMLSKLLRERISQMLPLGKHLQDSGIDIVNAKVKTIDHTGIFDSIIIAHFESKAIDIIESENLAASLSGKTKEEATEMLLARPEIGRVDIMLSPAWQNSLPRFSFKITIEQR